MSAHPTTETRTAAPAAAGATAPAAVAGAPREYLSFKLGNEEYGIDILRVQEIRGYEPPTRIANTQHFIKGVVNLRGVIVPIVDMRIRFGIGTPQRPGHTEGNGLGERQAVDPEDDVSYLYSDVFRGGVRAYGLHLHSGR